MKTKLFCLFTLLLMPSVFSCTVQVYFDTIAYSFLGNNQTSSFQYPIYSQNDLLYIKSLNLSGSGDCEGITVTPDCYLITPSGEKVSFFGLEDAVPLKNGTVVLMGLKNASFIFTRDAITYGEPLTATGAYRLGCAFTQTWNRASIQNVSSFQYPPMWGYTVHYVRGGDGIQAYPFYVENTSNKIKISYDTLAWPLGGILFFSLILFAVLYLLNPPRVSANLFVNWLTVVAALLASLGASLTSIYIFMTLAHTPEMEVNIFSFVSLAASLFVGIFVALIGTSLINKGKNKKKTDWGESGYASKNTRKGKHT